MSDLKEWRELILDAKTKGLTLQEVRDFINHSPKKKTPEKQTTKTTKNK